MGTSIRNSKLVKSLSLENFRGFYEKQTIKFSVPSGKNGSGLTIIVGQNNSGKSSILSALLRFSNIGAPNNFSKQERHGNNQRTTLVFTDADEKTKTIWGDSLDFKVLPSQNYIEEKNFEYLDPRKKWEGQLRRQGYLPAAGRSIEGYVNASVIDSGVLSLGTRHHNFLDPLIDIYRDKDLKARFDSAVKIFFEDFNDWFIELDGDQYVLEYKTIRNESHKVDLFGDGIISLFKFIAHLVADGSERIVVIDEPELFLHPQAQKKLAKQFSYISRYRQVILCTHSPYFINWGDVRNGCQIIRTSKKEDKCKISQIDSELPGVEKLLKLSNDWQKPQLLDCVAKELLFSDAVLFVEGQEDVGLISNLIKEKEMNINFDIFGYGTGGAGKFEAFLGIATKLGIKSGALFDKSKSIDAEKCIQRFGDQAFIRVHSKYDIRDKSESDVYIEGIFDKSGAMKTENEDEIKNLINEFCEYYLK